MGIERLRGVAKRKIHDHLGVDVSYRDADPLINFIPLIKARKYDSQDHLEIGDIGKEDGWVSSPERPIYFRFYENELVPTRYSIITHESIEYQVDRVLPPRRGYVDCEVSVNAV